MSSFYGRSGPSELLPRSIFLKPLVTGRRVLELGSVAATGGSTAVALLRLGARTVSAWDGDGAAIERARDEHRGSGVSFRTGRLDELPERSFDLVLVDDAARVVEPGAAGLLGRLLAPHGHLVVPVANPAGPSLAALAGDGAPAAGPGWTETTAALRPLFPSIEVATQQLLVGYVLAPVTGGEARLDIDATAGSAAAAYWLLLCGQRPTGLVDQALVALPPEPLFDARVAPAIGPAAERVAALEAQRDEARAGAERAAAEVERLGARVGEVEAALATERQRVQELRRAADSAREGLRERETWVDGLRVEVEGRDAEETRTQADLREATSRLARLEPELKAAQEMLKRVREQLAGKVRELASAQQAIAERTHDLRIAEEELERARAYAQEERQARLAAEAGARGAAPEADAIAAREDAARNAERIAALEAERAAAREDAARNEERFAALEAERAAAREESATRLAEAAGLRGRLADAEKERDEAAEALFAGLAERDRAVARGAELERALAEAREARPVPPNELAVNQAVAPDGPTATQAVTAAISIPPPEGGVPDGPGDADRDALREERDRLLVTLAERDHRLEATQRELVGQSDRIATLIAEIAELRARTPKYF
jgi:predicted  nucleic acid-binding Zn-ribbon protein